MRTDRRSPAARPTALLALALAGACASVDDDAPPAPAPAGGPAAPTAAEEADTDRVVAAVEAGDLETARAILGELLRERYVGEARTYLEADPPNPQDGLLWLDRALEIDPKDGEVLLMHAGGSMALAQQMIERQSNGIYITGAFEDALHSYREALRRLPGDPRALFGASRAAYNLLRPDEALDFAERGMAALDAGADEAGGAGIDPRPERTLAEVAYGAYANAVTVEEDPEKAARLFATAEASLERLLGLDAGDPWVWSTLSNLYLWEERTDDAKSALKRGLDRAPEDADLLAKLVELSLANGGAPAALSDINAFVNKHPEVAGGFWWLGRTRFDAAAASFATDAGAAEQFEAAERAFAQARELDPDLAREGQAYEVVCRAGVGWTRYHAGDLPGSTQAFLSMNDLFSRGIEWSFDDRGLRSGIQGLHYVGSRYRELGDLGAAAETYETLRELQPDNPDWPNNAGLFHRDRAVALEQLGRDLCRQSADLPDDEKEIVRLLAEAELADAPRPDGGDLAAVLHARAEEYLTRAREAIEKSYAAYKDAARLSPDDVRVVNDTALVLIYYVDRDLDYARDLLQRCIEMGTEQMQDESLGDDARYELENALGDAYQNMGFLHLVRLREPAAARPYLRQALGMGDPRPTVTGQLLPLCEESPDHPTLVELRSWGRPCASDSGGEDPVR